MDNNQWSWIYAGIAIVLAVGGVVIKDVRVTMIGVIPLLISIYMSYLDNKKIED